MHETIPPESTAMSNEHREQAREIVRLWCADSFDALRDGESMQSPPGAMTALAERIASALSSRDTEVREVLEGLAKWVNDNWCWCPQVARDGNGTLIHFDACVRTSTLYARLQPPEKSLPSE